MINNEIKIGKSYIKRDMEKILLCADIKWDNKVIPMFFEMDSKYEQYVCMGYSDPFVLMILEYAMAKSYNIVCEEPMTDTLWYKLQTFWIPVVAKNTKTFHKVIIVCTTTGEPLGGNGVATGLSCGVDSFYTVMRYREYPIKKYRLTHLFFLNNGAMGKSEYEQSADVFEKEKLHIQRAANEIGLELVNINTNMMQFYGEIYNHRANNNEGIKIAAAIYVLRGMVGTYYVAASFGLNQFKFSDSDVGYFMPFTVECVSTSGLSFIAGDVDAETRIERVLEIADEKIVQQYLHVNPINNCGHCPKCVRTQFELYVLGKLDLFQESFDIQDFKKKIIIRYAYLLANKHEWELGFIKEIQYVAKKNKVKLPLISYPIAALMWIPLNSPKLKNWIKKMIHYRS